LAIPLRRHASALGLLDRPGERSSHRVVTPRGGGVAIAGGAALALAWLTAAGSAGSAAWVLFAAAAFVGVAGLLDDRLDLPPPVKFGSQLAAALALLVAVGPFTRLPLPAPFDVDLPWVVLQWAFTALWITAVVNFFNFMDGIDGLATGQTVASALGVAAAGWSLDATALAIAAAAAGLGFLVHNAPPARIFMGDSGSGFLGFLLAGLPLLAPSWRRHEAIVAVAIGLALFLLDPLLTLVRRARAGKNLLRAHREHVYQQLVAPEEHAGRVTALYSAIALALSLVGAAGYHRPWLLWVGALAAVAVFSLVSLRAGAAGRAQRLTGDG
jgi:Fuc2NAc and GlcNAc transferase